MNNSWTTHVTVYTVCVETGVTPKPSDVFPSLLPSVVTLCVTNVYLSSGGVPPPPETLQDPHPPGLVPDLSFLHCGRTTRPHSGYPPTAPSEGPSPRSKRFLDVVTSLTLPACT